MKKVMLNLIYTLIIAGITSTSSASLITNGNFDNDIGLKNKKWGVFSEIDGWKTTGGPGIEVQKNTVVTAQSGSQYIELDSHGGDGGNSNTRMEQQDVFLSAGNYILDFYYRPRTNKADDNGINFGFSDGNTDFLTWSVDGIKSEWTNWQLVTEKFSITTEGTYNLFFSATGNYPNDGKSNTLGGFIDSVSLIKNPEPATMLLLGFGLIGLAGVSRRKQ